VRDLYCTFQNEDFALQTDKPSTKLVAATITIERTRHAATIASHRAPSFRVNDRSAPSKCSLLCSRRSLSQPPLKHTKVLTHFNGLSISILTAVALLTLTGHMSFDGRRAKVSDLPESCFVIPLCRGGCSSSGFHLKLSPSSVKSRPLRARPSAEISDARRIRRRNFARQLRAPIILEQGGTSETDAVQARPTEKI
jgi:hypothetical protein